MKIIKTLFKYFFALILVMLLLGVFVIAALHTPKGQDWAFNRAIHYLEEQTQTEIQIGKLSVSFPLNLRIEQLKLAQQGKPLLAIQQLYLSCSSPYLFEGRLVLSTVELADVTFYNLPNQKASSVPSEREWEGAWLPFYTKIENLQLLNVRFAPALVDALQVPKELDPLLKTSALNIQGTLINNPFNKSIEAHLLATIQDHQSEQDRLKIGLDAQNNYFSLSLHSDPANLPSFSALIPPDLKTHVAFYASAPFKNWQSLFQQKAQNSGPIEGHFKIYVNADEECTWPLAALCQNTTIRSKYLIRSLNEIELFGLSAEGPGFFLSGETILTSNQEIHHGNFKGQIDHLEYFQKWLQKEMQGAFAFEGHVAGSFTAPSLAIQLESPSFSYENHLFQEMHGTLHAIKRNQQFEGFITASTDYLDMPWQLATSFRLSDQQQIQLTDLRLDAQHSRLEGEMACSFKDFVWEGQLHAHSGNLADFNSLLKTSLSGEILVDVLLRVAQEANTMKHQAFDINLTGHSLRWQEEGEVAQLNMHLRADPLYDQYSTYEIKTELNGQQLRYKEQTIAKATLQATHRASLGLKTLTDLQAECTAQTIQWPNGVAEGAIAHVTVKNILDNPEGSIDFVLQHLKADSYELEQLQGQTTLTSTSNVHPFRLKGKGLWKEEWVIDGAGDWVYQQDLLECHVTHLNGHLGPYALQLMQPLKILHHPNYNRLLGLNIQWGEATLQGDFSQDNENFVSDFKTNAIPSELFHFVAPQLLVTGRTTFVGHLEGPLLAPQGKLKISLHRFQITEDIFNQRPFMEGDIYLDLAKEGVKLNTQLNGIGTTPVALSGYIPLKLSLLPLEFKLDYLNSFSLALNAEGELDPYLHLFYNNDINLSGHAKIALRLSGQMQTPQIQGFINLSQGSFESLSTGTLYHNIEARLEGDGSRVILKQFSAQDNKSGQILATGNVLLDLNRDFPFEFQIQPKQIFLLSSDYAAISASGNLTFAGNRKQAKLQGTLTVDQGTVHMEEALPRQIKSVDVRYINLPAGTQLPTYLQPKESSSLVTLEVNIHIPQKMYIKGGKLTSEWKGDILVTGTPSDPLFNGELRIVKGEFDLNGKVFNITQGTIHFGGPLGKKTTLYIVAAKDIDRIRAELIVKGPTSKPVISFRSNPPLAQRDVLSYILFNRGISDITPNQGEELTQSFMDLNAGDQSSSDDFLSRVRNNIGIDRLDFTTANENQDISLQAGKYITEGVFVSINKGISETANPFTVNIEANLIKNVKAQAEMGMDAPGRVSLKWKKDY